MTTVRIAHAEPRPGRLPNGEFQTSGYLIVLADDAAHRAVPVWLGDAEDLADLLNLPADQLTGGYLPQQLTVRLLGAAGARVTGVDIDLTEAAATQLSPVVTVARVGLASPAGTRQVAADLSLGLALAAVAGAPVRLAEAVLDRLAVPVPGDDFLTPFLDQVPPGVRERSRGRRPVWPLTALPARRPRFEPRNLDFADGLDWWGLDPWSVPDPDRPEEEDGPPHYTAATEDSAAFLSGTFLSGAGPRPTGSTALTQSVCADDYRGAMVSFSGEFRIDSLAGQAGPRLEVFRQWWRIGQAREEHLLAVGHGGRYRDWSDFEITARIPEDADLIRFGVGLAGVGRIGLRHPQLRNPGLPDPGLPNPRPHSAE